MRTVFSSAEREELTRAVGLLKRLTET
jgi:hypothetical protein